MTFTVGMFGIAIGVHIRNPISLRVSEGVASIYRDSDEPESEQVARLGFADTHLDGE